MGAKIGVLLNCGQQSQFSKVRREFDAGRVNLDPPMTCADWPVPGNLTLLHTQTAYTRKPLHRYTGRVIFFPINAPGMGRFQLLNLGVLVYGLELRFWVVLAIIVSLTLTIKLITTLTLI